MSATPTALAPTDTEEEALDVLIAPLRSGGRTILAEPPDAEQDAAFRAWVAAAALAAQRGLPPPSTAPHGFLLRVVAKAPIWVLSEDASRRRGSGVIALRVGPATPLLVEAPHTFFDKGTLPIALAVFAGQQARALIVNTSHRYGGHPKPVRAVPTDTDTEGDVDGDGGAAPVPSNGAAAREALSAALAFSDVAHAERSFFLTAHKVLLDSLPGLPTVQLHGFQDTSAPDVSLIASGVGRGADLDRLLAPLRAVLPDLAVLGYPKDIGKLGGMSNVQSSWSRHVGAPFYHVEISRTLRDRLADERSLLRRFAAAFGGVATIAPAREAPIAPLPEAP